MPLVQHSSQSPCRQPVCLLTHAPPSLRASAPPRLVPVQTRSPPERGAASEPSAGSPLWGGAARGAFRCSDRGEGFRFGQEFCGHRRLRHKPSLFSPLPALCPRRPPPTQGPASQECSLLTHVTKVQLQDSYAFPLLPAPANLQRGGRDPRG